MEERKTLSVSKEAKVQISEAELKEFEAFRAEKARQAEAEAKAKEMQEKGLVQVTIHLPPAGGKSIIYGGKEFMHGKTYEVPNDIKWGLEECMNRLQAHEASLHESENKGRQKRRAYVG